MIPTVSVRQTPSIMPVLIKHSKGLQTSGKMKLGNISLTSGQLDRMAQSAELYALKKIYAGSLCESSWSHSIDNLSGEWC